MTSWSNICYIRSNDMQPRGLGTLCLALKSVLLATATSDVASAVYNYCRREVSGFRLGRRPPDELTIGKVTSPRSAGDFLNLATKM